jgi:outer membrane biosynthesis protein TonB
MVFDPAFPSESSLFSALAEEPIFHVSEHRREDRRRRWLSLALVASAYGLIAAAMLLERSSALPRQTLEIPIEVVVAPLQDPPQPKPPEPEPKAAEKPKAPDKEDRPAYDAPKEGTARQDDVIDRKLDDKPPPALEAPASSVQASPGAEGREQAPKPQASSEASPQSPQPLAPPLKAADDGELPEASAAAPSAAPASPAKPSFAAGNGKLFAALPNVEFGGAPMKAPVAGGEGPAEYLNIVVGMVRARLHKPRLSRPAEGVGSGLIVFRLDGDGRIIDSWFVQHSGSAEYDQAEMEALTAAAPYPRPPYVGRAIEYHFLID